MDILQKKNKAIAPDNKSQEHYFAEWIGNCPSCGGFVKESWRFCPECSQKLKWEDNDEKL